MPRSRAKTKLALAVVVIAALVYALVKMDIYNSERRADQATPQSTGDRP